MRKSGVFTALGGAAILAVSAGITGASAASNATTATTAVRAGDSMPHAAPVTNGAWTVYHRDDGHTGFDPTQPAAAGATTGWVSATLDAAVYAEPLVYQGVVYVATLNNTVYALNQQDGTTIWSKNLGAPTSTGWICGNVSPQGILGTPVIDVAANRIYVTALLSTHTYWVFGLDLANKGSVVLQTALPTLNGTFDWKIQQERGALALANGYVYVPMGGRDGDCSDGSTPYRGFVFAVPTSGSGGTVLDWFSGDGASVWAAGGIAIDDSTGRLIFTTGQGSCPSTYTDNNDAVMRLSPTLAPEGFFAPFDWHNLSCTDTDVGSASPVLISPTLAFQAGKPGQGYLVNPQSLGGIDGQLYPAKSTNVPVCLGNSGAANYGGYAYAAPYVYLECEGSGITGLKIDTTAPSFSTCDATCASPSWNAGSGTYGAPIVAGGIVWAINTDGAGLTGFDATTGNVVFQSAPFAARRFSTPAEAGGQIFVPADKVVREFSFAQCTSVTLHTSPATSAPTGATVSLSATAGTASCTSPQYRFWIQPPGGAWAIVQDYSATSTFSWTSTGTAGIYHLEVDVRQTGSAAPYEAVDKATYTLDPCTGAGLVAMPASPQAPGLMVTLTGSATCPGTPTYRFWTGKNGTWTIVQDYSTSNQFNWNTASLAVGTYGLEVDVRNQNATAAYEHVANITYTLAIGPCTTPGLIASPAGGAPTGSTPRFTASTSGCPSPTYRFWVGQSGAWTIAQDYSSSNVFNWNTAGHAAGSYGVEVDVRNAGSSVAFDHVANIAYTLRACTAAAISANPASPHLPGGTITITGSASCPGTPTYRFWTGQNGTWTIAQDYSTSNTFAWNTSAIPTGSTYSLEVDVRNQGSTTPYERVAGMTYVLAAPPCTAPTLVASPPSSAATGATVTLKAATSGCPTPNYRFWISPPGRPWSIVQDYGASNTFSWTSTGVGGTYRLEVDVRDASSSVAYDHVANITYLLVGCSSAHLGADRTSPQPHGTTIVLTGSATCPGTAEYRFWVRDLTGAWTIAQDYSASNTFSWSTSTLAAGTYGLEVDVRDAGATSAYETVANITSALT